METDTITGPVRTGSGSGWRTTTYYPPLVPRLRNRTRPSTSKSARRTNSEIHAALFAASLDGRVECAGSSVSVESPQRSATARTRQRPSTAPAHNNGRGLMHHPAPELSWTVSSTRKATPDLNSQEGLLRSKLTIDKMEMLDRIEKDVLVNEKKRADMIKGDREERVEVQQNEKKKLNRGMATRARFLALVPPASSSSRLMVMSPELYEKWTPRTVACLYPEGTGKRPRPEPVVMTTVSTSMQAHDFDGKKAGVAKAMADTAGISETQVKVSKGKGDGKIDVHILARDDGEAAKVCNAINLDTLNNKLSANGVTKADGIEAPEVLHPGYDVFDFLSNTARLPCDLATSLVPQFVHHGFMTKSKVLAMTDSDLTACGVSSLKLREQILTYISHAQPDKKRSQSAQAASRPIPKSEEFEGMQSRIQEIKSRTHYGAADETTKYLRLRHARAGDKAFATAEKLLVADGNQSLFERVLDAKIYREHAMQEYQNITDKSLKGIDQKFKELQIQVRCTPPGPQKAKIKQEAREMRHRLLRDGIIYEAAKKKMVSLDQAIADIECTERALGAFGLEDGVSIVDKSRKLEKRLEQARENTQVAALTLALDNSRLFYQIEQAAATAATAAAHVQRSQVDDFVKRYRYLKKQSQRAQDMTVVEIVQEPVTDSERQVVTLLNSKPVAADPVVAVLLQKLDEQKDSVRKNGQEVAKVERWVQEVDRIRPSKRVDKKLNGVQRAPPGQPVVEQPPDPPSCMVNWKDQSVNLSTKLQTLLTSIGVSDRQEALEKTQQVQNVLNQPGKGGAAVEAAVQGILQELDYECAIARRDANLTDISTDDDESDGVDPQGDAEPERKSSNAAASTSFQTESKKDQKQQAAEAFRRAESAWNVPREKFSQIDFHSVKRLQLFSFSEEQISRARETEIVQNTEEKVREMYASNQAGIEGIIEGCRTLLKREKMAAVAADRIAERQQLKAEQLKTQVDDLMRRISQEPPDDIVLALTEELNSERQDIKSISTIFAKVAVCPGPVKRGSEMDWCWLHCCGHSVSDPECQKWIKKGNLFRCCGGEHWVRRKGDRLIKAKG